MPTPLALDGTRLPSTQAQRYWDQGFLFPVQAVTPEQAAAWRAELEGIERDWRDAGLPQALTLYKRVFSHIVMPLAHRIGMEPGILDVVEGILGPDILIYGVEFFIKEARSPQIVSMHQDLTYWGLGAIDGMVTVWLALSPATPASGCMDFVRGSHRNPILPHEDTFDDNNLLSRGQEVRVDVAPEDRVPIELMPGQISLHHGLTIHGSGPNGSDDRRIAAVIRYARPDIAQQTGHEDFAMMARGVDREGHFTHIAPPVRNFEPAALALHEQVRNAKAKILLAGSDTRKGVYAG